MYAKKRRRHCSSTSQQFVNWRRIRKKLLYWYYPWLLHIALSPLTSAHAAAVTAGEVQPRVCNGRMESGELRIQSCERKVASSRMESCELLLVLESCELLLILESCDLLLLLHAWRVASCCWYWRVANCYWYWWVGSCCWYWWVVSFLQRSQSSKLVSIDVGERSSYCSRLQIYLTCCPRTASCCWRV